ncbi:hypothetical protein GGR51DRAFT_394994 [Nemania sp. FL0031]|nr:hypothetical protein GGR51DRAFT_394994 [Nemania sp. FL0031]
MGHRRVWQQVLASWRTLLLPSSAAANLTRQADPDRGRDAAATNLLPPRCNSLNADRLTNLHLSLLPSSISHSHFPFSSHGHSIAFIVRKCYGLLSNFQSTNILYSIPRFHAPFRRWLSIIATCPRQIPTVIGPAVTTNPLAAPGWPYWA